jgi:flagellar basal body P-ring formation protein FlgA
MNIPPNMLPNTRIQLGLSGGSAGDIPLTVGQLTMGLFWWALWAAVCAIAVWCAPVEAQSVQQSPSQNQAFAQAFQQEVQALLKTDPAALPSAPLSTEPSVATKPRVEFVLGQLDPRLKLAPCDKVQTYLPEGARLWGRTHVGMRCVQGNVPWNVYWPVTVKVWSKAVVAVVPLRPGSIVTAADLRISEVDLAESSSPAVVNLKDVVGRSVTRLVEPGKSLRVDDVRMRRWFAAGDPVNVVVQGEGFAVASQGVAISHGDEGQCAKIRMDSQRVLCARPVAEHRAEITL